MAQPVRHNHAALRPAATDAALRRAARRAAAIAFALSYLLYALAIVLPLESKRAAHDESTYHLPTIRALADAAASPDLRIDLTDLRTATTPGYHAALALPDAALDLDLTVLRLLSAAFAAAALALAAFLVVRLGRGALSTAAVLLLLAPLALNLYVFSSATHLLPDNAGWLLVFAVLTLAIAGVDRLSRVALAAWLLLALVLVRQIHAWAAGLVLAAAWLDAAPHHNHRFRFLTARLPDRVRATVIAGLAVLPALAVTLAFVALWGGLVPPAFQGDYLDPLTGRPAPGNTGASPAFFIVTLASIGLYAPFFLPTLWPPLRRHLAHAPRRRLIPVVAAGLAAAALAAVPESSTSVDAGRFSAWWNLTGRFTIADRAPLMIALAALGGSLAALLAPLIPKRTALLFLGALLGITLAHTFNSRSFFRYVEPLTLLLLAGSTAAAAAPPDPTTIPGETHPTVRPSLPTRFILGPAALAAAFLLILVTTYRPA